MISKNIIEYYQLCAVGKCCSEHIINQVGISQVIFTGNQMEIYFRKSIGKYKLREDIVGGSEIKLTSADSMLPAVDDYLAEVIGGDSTVKPIVF